MPLGNAISMPANATGALTTTGTSVPYTGRNLRRQKVERVWVQPLRTTERDRP